MTTRQIVLDTETTGLDPGQGHRIIEIGCVELIDRKHTRKFYHQYINPEREVDAGALEVHGLSNDFLADKPLFKNVAEAFLEFVAGAELIIHNAPFDVGFINHELKLIKSKVRSIESICSIADSLMMARKKHPGQKNNLNALCKRYDIDNSNRTLHGALLDSEILADVYLRMTGGQAALLLDADAESNEGLADSEKQLRIDKERKALPIVSVHDDELMAHESLLKKINETSEGKCMWLGEGK